jgi:uncharacterized protein (UPF0332 family)
MNEQELLTYTQYRMDRAEKTLAEARTLFETAQMFGAVNRIYYAMFYAVSALACAHGFTTASHSQLRGYFNREFVKTGLIPAQHGKAYGIAFDSRKKGDYDDLVEFEKEQVHEMLREATEFLRVIKHLINLK